MSWYEQKRQFIDAAARTLWAMAWGDERENIVEQWRAQQGSPEDSIRSIEWHDRTNTDLGGNAIGTWGERQAQGHREFARLDGLRTLYLFDDEVDGDEPATLDDCLEARGWPVSMQGVELTDAAPTTPDYARLEAAILLGKLEQSNGASLAMIVEAARKADARAIDPVDECVHIDVEEFAHCVAMMATGTGVSWYDEHERFTLPERGILTTIGGRPFRVPSIEFTYEEGEE